MSPRKAIRYVDENTIGSIHFSHVQFLISPFLTEFPSGVFVVIRVMFHYLSIDM
jgi:uncharacterized membrane protein